ncbi:MAG: hypothetical protein RH949_19690 [Coleofasciculus sp. A1-SPW-01]|uniref:hypothetical protein n=1 Tax=Coleofasciculus TaxID=669368 RepID=UPI0005C731E1|nr:hypothetical protein [Coleofasciculus chthonoplastes]
MGGNVPQLLWGFSTLSPYGGDFQAIAVWGSQKKSNGKMYPKIQKFGRNFCSGWRSFNLEWSERGEEFNYSPHPTPTNIAPLLTAVIL